MDFDEVARWIASTKEEEALVEKEASSEPISSSVGDLINVIDEALGSKESVSQVKVATASLLAIADILAFRGLS
jgi:hypothetical protein